MSSWKLTARAPRAIVEAALAAQGMDEDWDPEFVVGGSEVAEAPEDWLLEGWLPRKPNKRDTSKLSMLFPGSHQPEFAVEKLPDTDWVTHTQQEVTPIRAGPFHVRTPDFPPPADSDLFDFEIPAAQAFGTGHHETTAGCLELLAEMRRMGMRPRRIADIGTGTGLLAFAGLRLWPRALATASDIDPVCAYAVFDNASRNRVPVGTGRGELAFTVAAGMDDEILEARAPYDLLIANILAGPLIELAPDFARAVAPRGSVLLAGLLESQESAVRAAYRRAGFRIAARLVKGDWSILWLRKRFSA